MKNRFIVSLILFAGALNLSAQEEEQVSQEDEAKLRMDITVMAVDSSLVSVWEQDTHFDFELRKPFVVNIKTIDGIIFLELCVYPLLDSKYENFYMTNNLKVLWKLNEGQKSFYFTSMNHMYIKPDESISIYPLGRNIKANNKNNLLIKFNLDAPSVQEYRVSLESGARADNGGNPPIQEGQENSLAPAPTQTKNINN